MNTLIDTPRILATPCKRLSATLLLAFLLCGVLLCANVSIAKTPVVKTTVAKISVIKANSLKADTAKSDAQKAEALSPHFLYRTQAQDTPLTVAKKFFNFPTDAATLASFLKVNNIAHSAINRVIAVDTVLQVPLTLTLLAPTQAKVLSILGEAKVQLASTNARALQVGDLIGESSIVSTGAASVLKLALPDGTVLGAQEDTQFKLQTMKHWRGTDIFQINISELKGRLETKVSPIKSAAGGFNIQTKRTVTGVRGTQFNVADTEIGNAVVEVQEGSVALTDERPVTVILYGGSGAFVAANAASSPIPLLAKPQASQAVIDDLKQISFPSGTDSIRVDVYSPKNETLLLSSTVSKLLQWPKVIVDNAAYPVNLQAIDKNGLQGFVGQYTLVNNQILMPPSVAWQAEAKRLAIKPSEDATGIVFEYAPWHKQKAEPGYETDRYIVPMKELPAGTYKVRAASMARDLGSPDIRKGRFGEWIPIVIP